MQTFTYGSKKSGSGRSGRPSRYTTTRTTEYNPMLRATCQDEVLIRESMYRYPFGSDEWARLIQREARDEREQELED
jgi:hypothetical protein